ncbi:DUF5368 domain-containing protein [Acuticoccus mangrovi]|uniref:DUF5368 domain-containing protein n=1 Tax=Acuticoccus mangrovi TaxID=2796142 RepID=A0A934MGF8_9HYPH|nr:DUF5368 domain-containing protein [Acuticoccus mangrovi]MBJ3775885.1 DUF5368 domain-containing protein [Acuticoccus mangrovi]
MKELTPSTLVAVFEEIFGRGLFWAMVVTAAVVTLAYFYVLIRDRRVSWQKFLFAQLSMPVGAVGAVFFVMWATHSEFADIGGPIDVIVLLAVAVAGAIGMAILVYTLESFLVRRKPLP